MWDHREYLIKQAVFRIGMAKEAGLLDLIGKGAKGVAQIGQSAVGMAKELPGAVKSFGSELGNAAKGAMPVTPAAPLTGLAKLKADNLARQASRVSPKLPMM